MSPDSRDPKATGSSRTRHVLVTVLKWGLVVLAVVFLAREITQQWLSVRDTLVATPVWSVLLSLFLAAAAVAASGEQQRGLLLAMGYRLGIAEWFRVFFVAQLGKYVPGTAWAYVSQMELSRAKGIRRATSVAVMLLGAGMTVLTSFALGWVSIGEGTVTWLPTWLRAIAAGCGVACMVAVMVRARWVGALLAKLPERFRVGRSDLDLASLPSLWGPSTWTVTASVLYGFHVLVLSLPSGGFSWSLTAQSVGGFATAWVVGFLAFVVPAGVGVREVVLAAFLTPSLGSGGALAVVVVSRFVIIIAEALLMASAPLLGERSK
ncbi:hypothetical protein ACFQWG_02815 [Schaalia naturae]|uniref:Uncharacterized protein n=1 Tax=Schaalia naturae TaxID=635203 RepID=A0ABW2SKR9_9ACTO